MILTCVAALLLVTCAAWPKLPLSRGVLREVLGVLAAIRSKVSLGKAIVAVSLALLLFAAFWALQGDAPIFMAMILPELAAWLTTFEITTLADALVGAGTAFVALKAAVAGNYLKGRVRARRTRRSNTIQSKAANDDEPAPDQLAAYSPAFEIQSWKIRTERISSACGRQMNQ